MRNINTLEKFFRGNELKPLYLKSIDDIKSKLTTLIQNNTPMFYFTDHGIKHSDRINNRLSKLFYSLFANEDHNVRLNNPELYSLVSAIYLHDIGMELVKKDTIIELFTRKNYRNPFHRHLASLITVDEVKTLKDNSMQFYNFIREKHHIISAMWIMNNNRNNVALRLPIRESFLQPVALICFAHNENIRILRENFYCDTQVDNENIQIKVLSYLLRVGDALDADMNRCNIDFIDFKDIDVQSKIHWYKHYYTKSINPENFNIKILFEFPDDSDWNNEVGKYLTRQTVEWIKKNREDAISENLFEGNVRSNYLNYSIQEKVNYFVKRIIDYNTKDAILKIIKKKITSTNGGELDLEEESLKKQVLLRRKIAATSKTYEQSLRSVDGRFFHLKISDAILPHNTFFDSDVRINDENNLQMNASLQALWDKEGWHAFIVGEGGMGKTVSLVRLWEHFLKDLTDERPVPIFVALNEYNNQYSTVNTDKNRNFIIQSISKNYLDEKHISKENENLLWKIMKTPITYKEKKAPAFILLLDGFNEITVDRTEILKELHEIMTSASGVQIVITSRIDMRHTLNLTSFNRIDLLDLNEKQIEEYLEDVNCIKPTGKLLGLIRNPMMLTLYSASCSLIERHIDNTLFEFKKSIETVGETLWNFIESHLAKKFDDNYNTNDVLYYKFILKNILPYIGYGMEMDGKFSLTLKELKQSIHKALEQLNDEEFFDTFPCYEECEKVVQLINHEESNLRERFNKIKEVLCNELIVLVEENFSFRFIHQHFRDFCSAVHILNRIHLGIVKNQIPKVLRERTLPIDIRRFIGEIEGERYNVPQLNEIDGWYIKDNSETSLNSILKLCKNKFDGSIGYAVWNIIEIWKVSRKELTGLELTNLDLSGVMLNRVKCYRWYKDKLLTVKFNKSRVSELCILPQGHSGEVNSAVYSSDGKKILSASFDGTIKEWNVDTGECICTYEGHSGEVNSAIYSSDGKKILSASYDKTIKEWSVDTGQCISTYKGHSEKVNSAVYSGDDKKILSASHKAIKEWSIDTGYCISTYEGHSNWITSAIYSSDSKKILSASDWSVKEWNVDTNDCIFTYEGHSNLITSAVYSSDGKKILSASYDKTIKEWSVDTGQCIRTYKGHSNFVNSAAYNNTGKKILSTSDWSIKEWSIDTGDCISTYEGHSNFVNSAVYSSNAKKILSASHDKTIKEWSVDTGGCIRTYESYSEGVASAVYSSDGKKILSALYDKTVKEWSVDTGDCISTYEGHSEKVNSAVYSSDGKKILSASYDKTIKEWSVDTGQCISTYEGHSNLVLSAVYSSDDKKVLSASYGAIKEWSVDTGQCIFTYEGHSNWINSVVYSSDDKKILSASGGTIKEWSVDIGDCIFTYKGHSDDVISAVYSSDGKKILSASYDKTIKEWSVDTGQCISTYEGHSNLVFSAVYSSDGKKILSASNDKTIREWSVDTGDCIATYEGHSNFVNSVVYSSDGKKILSASYDKTIKEWNIDTDKCIHTYRNIIGLLLKGCSFLQLHSKSKISKKTREVLKMYGVIIDDEQ